MTANTVATITSLIEPEAITVQLETLRLLAIANYLFIWGDLFGRRVVIICATMFGHSFRFVLTLLVLAWLLLIAFSLFSRMFGFLFLLIFRTRSWLTLTLTCLIDWRTLKLAGIASAVLARRLKDNPTLNGILPSIIVIDLSVLLRKRSFHNY